MTEIRFYHLVRSTLEQALPRLLEKTQERGWRAVVVAGSEERVEDLANHLWLYEDRSFLPHGSARDGNPTLQPVWLTTEVENPNGAEVLFMTDGCACNDPSGFSVVCDLFDGTLPEHVEAARERYRRFRAAGHTLGYWQQDERGAWRERRRDDSQ